MKTHNINMKSPNLILIPIVIIGLALLPKAQAVSPPPDGGYPGGNTAEGQDGLLSLTTGGFNTAVGFLSLRSNTAGSFNTGVGAGTLLANTGDQNTGSQNTATGAAALLSNNTGSNNTANGAFSLFSNTTGVDNTANGTQALKSNTTGRDNTANGFNALQKNDTGDDNTANGVSTLFNNATGNLNTAIGYFAGLNQTTGSNNVYIGSNIIGVAGESNTCYIKSIFGQTTASGIPVFINSNSKLGTTTSSKRFKEEIKAMDKSSEALFELNPVTFRYKREIDPAGTRQLGLVAEEVEKVNPDLVVRDKEGKPYSVRYEQVNAMLLNEFLKEHKRVQSLEATVAQQQRKMDAVIASVNEQTAQIQKVSAQVEASKPAPQVVNNP